MPALPVEWFVGPVAALALALVIARELWRSHKAADAREVDRADRAEARLEKFLQIIDEKTESK